MLEEMPSYNEWRHRLKKEHSSEWDDDAASAFYSQIVMNTLPHRSVSVPTTPRSSSFRPDTTDSKLEVPRTIEHSAVVAKALRCQAELVELLTFVRQRSS